jgi:hypothetical protein
MRCWADFWRWDFRDDCIEDMLKSFLLAINLNPASTTTAGVKWVVVLVVEFAKQIENLVLHFD